MVFLGGGGRPKREVNIVQCDDDSYATIKTKTCVEI